ncbi:MAG: alpha/beta hydrolase-fold protein [Terracidiphilus sp.]
MIRKIASDFVQLQNAIRIAAVLAASVPMAAFGQGTGLVSPELHKDGSVTFRLERSGAHEVSVALAGLETPLKMTQAQGVWSVTSAPLASGTYWYSYLVDGKAQLDPLNADVVPNYSFLNSVVRVPGPGGQPWERTNVPHGEVHHHFYESKIARGLPGGRSEYFVYTPPGYDPRASTRYPTLYLLHGLSQGAIDWTVMGGANFVLDTLIAQGKAKPMVVVMPLGYGDLAVAGKQPSDDGFGQLFVANNALFRDVFLTEIVPRVEAEYRVLNTADGKAIAGLSMGALQSLDIGLNSASKGGPGEFAWVGGFSAPAQFLERPAASGQASKLRLLWIGCGTGDGLLESNRKLTEELQAKGYTVKAVEKPGAHIWPVWQRDLVDFVQLLF